jgi:hypothetical protein
MAKGSIKSNKDFDKRKNRRLFFVIYFMTNKNVKHFLFGFLPTFRWHTGIYIKLCSHEVAKNKSGVICQFHLTVPPLATTLRTSLEITFSGPVAILHFRVPTCVAFLKFV